MEKIFSLSHPGPRVPRLPLNCFYTSGLTSLVSQDEGRKVHMKIILLLPRMFSALN